MLLLLYPRNHCLIQIYKPFPPSTFPFMFWSLTYFDLIFVYSIRKEPNFCVFHIKSFLSTIWEYVPFPIELSKPSWKILFNHIYKCLNCNHQTVDLYVFPHSFSRLFWLLYICSKTWNKCEFYNFPFSRFLWLIKLFWGYTWILVFVLSISIKNSGILVAVALSCRSSECYWHLKNRFPCMTVECIYIYAFDHFFQKFPFYFLFII